MYAIAVLRYRKSLEEVLPHVDNHRAYVRLLKERGVVLVSGIQEPRYGGIMLLRVPDEDFQASLDRVRDDDPYVHAGVVQYELLPWNPLFGREDLDRL